MDCYRTGAIVTTADLTVDKRWPRFATESLAAGFPAVCAIPMRLRSDVIGGLNLFMSEPRPLTDDDVKVAQALSDIACIAIFQHRATQSSVVREEQLQLALDSRIVIEQAKGIIGERGDVSMNEAFVRLRRYARNNNLRLADVAVRVIAATVDINAVNSQH